MSVNWALMTAGSLKFVSISYQSTDVIVERDTTPTIWETVRVSVCVSVSVCVCECECECVCVCVFFLYGVVYSGVCVFVCMRVCECALSLSIFPSPPLSPSLQIQMNVSILTPAPLTVNVQIRMVHSHVTAIKGTL